MSAAAAWRPTWAIPPSAPAGLIARLAKDRKVVYEIGKRGQEVVLRDFSFTRMMQGICESFQMVYDQQTKAPKPLSITNGPEFSQP